MKTKSIIEGMQILSKYYNDPDGFNTGADHDIIYMFATDIEVSDEDKAKLEELGWDNDGEGEPWSAFT